MKEIIAAHMANADVKAPILTFTVVFHSPHYPVQN